MGPVKIGGLPAHILLVHLAVVAIPLAALLTILSAVWPAARAKLGFITPLVALGALIVVPITTHAGEWLLARVTPSARIAHHAHLGREMLPWAIGLFVVAAGEWIWFRYRDSRGEPAPAADGTARAGGLVTTGVLAVLALAVGVGSVVQIYRVGESGSRAVWTGSFSATPHN